MGLKATLLLFACLGCLTTIAGNREEVKDSLRLAWEDESVSDSLRLQAMRILIRDSYLYSDPDSAFILAEELKTFAKETGFQTSVTHAMNTQGITRYLKGDIKGAIGYFNKTLELNKELDFVGGIAASFNSLGAMHNIQGKYEKALEYYKKSLKYREELGEPRGIGRTLCNIGLVYSDMGNEEKHIEYLKRSLEIFEQSCDQKGMADVNTNIGKLYSKQGNYRQALSYLSSGLEAYEKAEDKVGMIAAYINIGITHSAQEMPEKAIEYCKKSLRIAEESGDQRGIALALDHLGINRITTGSYTASSKCFDRSLKIGKEIGDPQIVVSALQHIGQIHFIQNEPDSALNYLNQGLNFAEEKQLKKYEAKIKTSLAEVLNATGELEKAEKYGESALKTAKKMEMISTLRDISKTLYQVYSTWQNYREALKMHELHVEMRDSISNRKNQRQVLQQEFKYQNEKRQALAEQERESQLAVARSEMERESFKTNTYISGSAALFLLLVMFLAHRKINQQRIENRRIKEMDKFKHQFFSNITHDFKTPLTLILNPAERLLRRMKDPSDKEELSRIHHNANYLHRLINQLLKISERDSELLKSEPIPGDLDDFVNRTVSNFSKNARSRSIQLEYESSVSDNSLMFDPRIVETVIYNLLNNAITFTPEGGRIDVALRIESNSIDDAMILCVSDTGKGIPAELHDKVFERHFTDDKGENNTSRGTGIGLAIVRELAEVSGGSVSLKSTPGVGSEFKVVLPLHKDVHAGKAMEVEQYLQTELEEGSTTLMDNVNGKPLVLVVEDNSDMRKMVANGLEAQYRVLEAMNGVEALEMAEKHIPDIVVSDVMMPEMDGLKFARKMNLNAATSHIPVILLTAKGSNFDRESGLKSGAIAYLTKPYHEPELLALIASQIQLRNKSWEYFEHQNGVSIKTIDVESDKIVSDLREFIRENALREDLNIDEVCRHAGFSRTQLYRKLKGTTGKSTGEFIKWIRLELAAEILLESELSVSEVAYQTGFSTHSHFSKCFAEEFSISPREYALSQK